MSEAKKVLHVTMRWGCGVGGVKRFIHNAVEALPKDEYRQVVASLGPITGDSQGLTVLGPVIQGGAPFGKLGMHDVVRFFMRESPDIVHIHCNNGMGLLCAEAARRSGISVRVVHSHNSSLGSEELWKRAGDSVLKLLCSNAPTARVACSVMAGDWLFSGRSYSVIRNGIDLNRFAFSAIHRSEIRRNLGISEDALVIGIVGAGIPVKNASFSLDLLACMREEGIVVHLVLIGEGEESASLLEKSRQLGLSSWTHFTGTVPDVWRYYSAMDCLVMPSFYEGLPISLIEAQASGLCCVVSDSVSRESDLAGLLTFLSLSAKPQAWTKAFHEAAIAQKRTDISRIAISKLRSAGYSINDLREQLINTYEKGNAS